MTLFKPTLQLSRMRVRKDASIVYDEVYHNGVNIIRGQNSSGKSTIIDLIAYSLGAENIAWKPEALLCDSVHSEVLVNGHAVTLHRVINAKSQNPLAIYWGDIDAADRAPASEWQLFPFRRSGDRQSFSQVLFRALEMPEVRGSADSNITMHQILRLLYVDQRSSHSSLFRFEPFDTVLTRETVGNYLFGVFDDALYEAQLLRKRVDAELGRIVAELTSIFSVLGRSGQETNFEWIEQEVNGLQAEEAALSERIITLKAKRANEEKPKDPGLKEIRKNLSIAKQALAAAEDRLVQLELDIQDSRLFMDELERRVTSLSESAAARSYLGSLQFSLCPCCLAKLDEQSSADVCGLCKSTLSPRAADTQIMRMRNELEVQRRESVGLMQRRVSERDDLRAKMPALRNDLKALERQYSQQVRSWSTAVEAEIEQTSRKSGEISQRIKQLVQYLRMGGVLGNLQRRRAELGGELEGLDAKIEQLTESQERRKQEVRRIVAQNLLNLLHADVHRQEEFSNAENVEWSFGDNQISVNGQTNFSESSMVILRHSFRLAMLLGSATYDAFRIPRFLILDGIEDGGLETPRAQHFQRLIVEASERLSVEHQIIFATSQIDPLLDREGLVVGRSYTSSDKSLNIKTAAVKPLLQQGPT